MAQTRKTISWALSALLHAVILFILRAGYRYAFTEGEVTIEPFAVPKGVQVEAKSESKDMTETASLPEKKTEGEANPKTKGPEVTDAPIPLPVVRSDTTAPEVRADENTSANESTEEPPPAKETVSESQTEKVEEAPAEEADEKPTVAATPTLPAESAPSAIPNTDAETVSEEVPPQSSAAEAGSSQEGIPQGGTQTAQNVPKFGAPGSMIDESKLVELPGNRPPSYPRMARTLGQEGDVVIRAFIKRDGTVDLPILQKSSGHALLDKEALSAYSRYRFKPGVSGWVIKTIRFRFKK